MRGSDGASLVLDRALAHIPRGPGHGPGAPAHRTAQHMPGPRTCLLALGVIALLLVARPALGQAQLSSGTVIEAVERLRPGEYLWAPDLAPAGPVLLVVSVTTQRAILYRNGLPIAISTVSTGREGYRTPTGVFTVLQKQVEHYSSIYDNAPMPYMQRLTWQGVALHGGDLPGYPASHGCIRLPKAFAQLLYGVTRLGMTVIVTDATALPRLAPQSDPAKGVSDLILEHADAPDWHPEESPTGPVSIIISAADRRIIVLRDGRVIGSAPIAISDKVAGTSAYMLRDIDQIGYHWLTVPLPGQPSIDPVPNSFWQRFSVDPGFRASVAGIIVPGTTVVLTPDALAAGSAGKSVTVIEADPGARR